MRNEKKIEFDYSKLRGRIREIYGSYSKLSDELSFTTVTLSRKLNGKGYFGGDEIIELADALNIKEEDINDYFFNLIVRKDEPIQKA